MTYDLDTPLDFGKFKGRTIEDILEEDGGPGYLLWALENVERFETDKAIQDLITRAARR